MTQARKLKAVSLFTGVGGFDLGAQRAGIKVVAQVERDHHCCKVLRRRFSDAEIHNDVRTFSAVAFRPDIICGGFPCQDLSVAGRRAGLDGERSGLWFEFRRIVAESRPEWVCIENVPGLLSSDRGGDMSVVLSGLADLGYWWAYRVFDSQWFGVAQRRRRVFIVGHLGNVRRCAEILFEREGLPWDSPPSREAVAHAAALTSRGVGTCGADDNQAQANHLVAHPLKAGGNLRHDESHETYVTHTLRGEGFDASEDGTGRGTPLGPVAFQWANSPSQTMQVSEHATDPLRATRNGTSAIAYQCHGSNVGPMGTLRAGNGNETGGVPFTVVAHPLVTDPRGAGHQQAWNTNFVGTEYGVRRLTPRECERLQGFVDSEHHVTIEICSEHQSSHVDAAIQSLRSRRPVGNVESARALSDAEFAEQSFTQSDPRNSRLAPLLAHISCADNEVVGRNQNGSRLFAASAVSEKTFRLPTQNDDFARLIAGICITADQAIHGGAAGSHQNEHCLIRLQDGRLLVRLYGNEITQRASDALHGSDTGCVLTKSTIESLLSSGGTERKLQILCCSVVHAMSGFIHERTCFGNSLRLELSARLPWTRYAYDGGEISDSARYRMLGNAVTVDVAEWIFKRLVKSASGRKSA